MNATAVAVCTLTLTTALAPGRAGAPPESASPPTTPARARSVAPSPAPSAEMAPAAQSPPQPAPAASTSVTRAAPLAAVRRRVFDIYYRVNRAALPLRKVELWYRLGREGAWRRYGLDSDLKPPVAFDAAKEGLYGFYLILSNATGTSSQPPTAKTQPQQWAFVDYTPPMVQVHAPLRSRFGGQNILQIRWTAVDPHLPPRPIELAYRPVSGGAWTAVVPDRLTNTGRYDWRVGEDVPGRIVLRVRTVDRGGNDSEAVSELVDLSAPVADAGVDTAMPGGFAPRPQPTPDQRARARRLYALAMEHRSRGDWTLAIARLRDSLQLDPTYDEAAIALGAVFYDLDRLDDASAAYDRALGTHPQLAGALKGRARVLARLHDYPAAAADLARIIETNPNDVATLKDLGDLAIKRGDELAAREYYYQAATRNPDATDVIRQVRRRLENIDALSRRYRAPSAAAVAGRIGVPSEGDRAVLRDD